MRFSIVILLLVAQIYASAQDSTEAKQPRFTVNGYIKNLESLTFTPQVNELTAANEIHNRINIKWRPTRNFTGAAEFRNRLIWGDVVRQNPDFIPALKNDNEWMDLQKVWLSHQSLVLYTNTERLYLDYRDARWNVRIGRQRINWGVTTTWNPNDIFNAYNFPDFDYEERPGSDGGKVQYFLSDFSSIELACTNAAMNKGTTVGFRYSLDKWKYDMHLIGGWYRNYPTIGAGWAGNISQAGFKGEVQYFFPYADSMARLNVSAESDYMFGKGWYLNIGGLYASYGTARPIEQWQDVRLQFSPMYLMSTKWNLIATGSKEFTPLFTGSLSVIYAPGTNLLILFPTLQYNLATNLDVSLIWQSYFLSLPAGFQAVSHTGFLRLKWSF